MADKTLLTLDEIGERRGNLNIVPSPAGRNSKEQTFAYWQLQGMSPSEIDAAYNSVRNSAGEVKFQDMINTPELLKQSTPLGGDNVAINIDRTHAESVVKTIYNQFFNADPTSDVLKLRVDTIMAKPEGQSRLDEMNRQIDEVRDAGATTPTPSAASIPSLPSAGTTFQQMGALATQLAAAQSAAAVQTAEQIAEGNLARFPRAAEAAATEAATRSRQIDKQLASRFYRNLENVLPDWREQIIAPQLEALDVTRGLAADLSTGQIPQDVAELMQRTLAESNMAQGLFGQAPAFREARTFGETSLALRERGAQLFGGAVTPLTQQLLSTVGQLQPPVSDPQALYGAALGAAVPGTQISPTAGLQTAASLYGGAAGLAIGGAFDLQRSQLQAQTAIETANLRAATEVGLAEANLNWSRELSAMNMAMDTWATNLQVQMNADAKKTAQRNQNLSAWSQVLGGQNGIKFDPVQVGKDIWQGGRSVYDYYNIGGELSTEEAAIEGGDFSGSIPTTSGIQTPITQTPNTAITPSLPIGF